VSAANERIGSDATTRTLAFRASTLTFGVAVLLHGSPAPPVRAAFYDLTRPLVATNANVVDNIVWSMQRRRLLKRASALGVIGLAGCSGSENAANGGKNTTSSGMAGTSTDSTNGSSGGGMNANGSGTTGTDTGSTNGSGGSGMGSGSSARNPKAGQTAYESVRVAIAFDSPTSAAVTFQLPEPVLCSVAYGTDASYGTLRTDETMTGPEKNHHVPITTKAGRSYHAKLDLFDTKLDALQTADFTFTAPNAGSETRSSTQTLTYTRTAKAEPHLAKHPSLTVGKQTVSVAYQTTSPVLGAVRFRQGGSSTVRRDLHRKPHTNHTVTIHGLDGSTQTNWAIGLIEPDASMYTTVGMSFETK